MPRIWGGGRDPPNKLTLSLSTSGAYPGFGGGARSSKQANIIIIVHQGPTQDLGGGEILQTS